MVGGLRMTDRLQGRRLVRKALLLTLFVNIIIAAFSFLFAIGGVVVGVAILLFFRIDVWWSYVDRLRVLCINIVLQALLSGLLIAWENSLGMEDLILVLMIYVWISGHLFAIFAEICLLIWFLIQHFWERKEEKATYATEPTRSVGRIVRRYVLPAVLLAGLYAALTWVIVTAWIL